MAMTREQIEAREAEYVAMVGKKFGKLTILEYLPREIIYGEPARAFRCRCDCGYEGKYRAPEVYAGRITRCSDCANSKSKTLCFDCASSTNRYLCPWAGGRPRKDWTVELVNINNNGKKTKTWRVIECPGFARDKRR